MLVSIGDYNIQFNNGNPRIYIYKTGGLPELTEEDLRAVLQTLVNRECEKTTYKSSRENGSHCHYDKDFFGDCEEREWVQ